MRWFPPIFTFACFIFLSGGTSRAARFTASDVDSLRAAIHSANATPGSDVIVLEDSIFLSDVDHDHEGPNGLPDVVTPIVLMGHGHSITRGLAAPLFRIFHVIGGFFDEGDLVLDNVRISGGDVTGGTDQPANAGGGVLNRGGRVTLRNGTQIDANRAHLGGGIYNTGTLKITDAVFDNRGGANSAFAGGAIYGVGVGDTSIIDSEFSANEAEFAGGAIYNATTLRVENCLFSENVVTGNSPADGGAFYNASISGVADFFNSTFQDNSAARGGAVANSNASKIVVTNSEFVNNFNPGFGAGGAVWTENNADFSAYGTTFENNRTHDLFSNDGGAIFCGSGSELTLVGCSVVNNVASGDGGGIYIQSSSSSAPSLIAHSVVDGNSAVGDGGGIDKKDASPVTIIASSISGNTNTGFNGGGLAVDGGFGLPPVGVSIEWSTIADNQMINGNGGGISNLNQGVIAVLHSTLSGNAATGAGGAFGLGGGIYTNQTNSSVSVTNSTISGNTANTGGGVYNANASTMTLEHVTVVENTVDLQGAGTYAPASATIGGTVIAVNTANHPVNPPQHNCGPFAAPGSYIDGGNNMIDENTTSECPAGFTVSATIDFLSLDDHGGPTETHPLGGSSSAVDAAGACGLATDQRGFPRDAACDVGAYEAGNTPAVIRFETETSIVQEGTTGHEVNLVVDNQSGTITGGSLDIYVTVGGSAVGGGSDHLVTTSLPLSVGAAQWPPPGEQATVVIGLDTFADARIEGTETVTFSISDLGLAGPADAGSTTQHEVQITDVLSDLVVTQNLEITADNNGNQEADPGDTVAIEVTIENTGTQDALGVVIDSELDGARFDLASVVVDASLGNYDPNRGEWSQNGSGHGDGFDVAAGTSETLSLEVQIGAAVSGGQSVTHTSAISTAYPPRIADPNPENDRAMTMFQIACQNGFRPEGTSCLNIDECLEGTDNCDVNALCLDTPGGFECSCPDGFVGDGLSCEDIDECTDETDDCSDLAECQNVAGGFTCTCVDGYSGDGVVCEDVDECTDQSHDCDPNASCTNTVGDFSCTCNEGFSGDGKICSPICGDGRVAGIEDCDDGNLEDDDGCSANCSTEAGWVCDGSEPSVCVLEENADAGLVARGGDGCACRGASNPWWPLLGVAGWWRMKRRGK